jgi:hypothetical protein
MKVNFFSRISIDSDNLTDRLLRALDTDEYYFIFKWNKGPVVVLFQLTLFDDSNVSVANYLPDGAITSQSGDIAVPLKNLKGVKKGMLVFGIRAIDDVAKSAVFLVKEGAPNTLIKKIPAAPDKFEKIDSGSDFPKDEITLQL